MKTRMDFTVTTTCRIDNAQVPIAVTVDVGNEMLHVEDLLEVTNEIVKEPTTQEDFTRHLHHRLKMPVRTVGIHSGVTITCEA